MPSACAILRMLSASTPPSSARATAVPRIRSLLRGARVCVAMAAAYEARKALGPEYEHAVLESFVDRAAAAIDQRVDDRLAQRRPQGRQPEDAYVAVPVFSLLVRGARRG